MNYKGKLLFEFTKEGLWLPYEGGEILRSWKSIFRKLFLFWSKEESYTDNSLGKVEGFHFKQILWTWIQADLKHGYYLILYDINVGSKPTEFWDRIPSSYKKELIKDVVLLRCKSKKEVKHLCDSINEEFAQAVGIDHGKIICVNED